MISLVAITLCIYSCCWCWRMCTRQTDQVLEANGFVPTSCSADAGMFRNWDFQALSRSYVGWPWPPFVTRYQWRWRGSSLRTLEIPPSSAHSPKPSGATALSCSLLPFERSLIVIYALTSYFRQLRILVCAHAVVLRLCPASNNLLGCWVKCGCLCIVILAVGDLWLLTFITR